MTRAKNSGKRARRGKIVAGVVAVALACSAAVAAAALGGFDGDRAPAARSSQAPASTAAVEKGDLTRTTQVPGVLSFTAERNVDAGGQGVVTWLPAAGAEVRRDGRLFEMSGRAARLLYGDAPMYRELSEGSEGEDVAQLKRNLIDLGLGAGLAADDEFTAGTTRAVKAWQERHDMKPTGKVGPQDVVFLPSAVRVQQVRAHVGQHLAPGGEVLTTTGTARQVTFQADVEDAADLAVGDGVQVDLPGGKRTGGRISTVGRVVEPSGDEQGQQEDGAKVDVVVTLDDAKKIDGVDQAPVTVRIEGESRKDVLHVPVGALLAGPRGTFLVEVAEGGTTRRVTVELGLFADGRVEIEGPGLREGTRVGVPRE
ncbi:peptidoglycan-binding protein [Streptomyces sp. NPDC096105]|uniref:peptidoglycan-binding protein n=1 Tax=Streptomyces sp. NPDC096105 TaxID=3366074 RepID=UPI00380FE22E